MNNNYIFILCCSIFVFSCASKSINNKLDVIFFIDESKIVDLGVVDDFYFFYEKSKRQILDDFGVVSRMVKNIDVDKTLLFGDKYFNNDKKCNVGLLIVQSNNKKILCGVSTDLDIYNVLLKFNEQ